MLGASNLLERSAARADGFLIPGCPDFTDVVFSAFQSAPSPIPDQVAHTLAAMADGKRFW